MSSKFIVIWNVCWIAVAPVAFLIGKRLGRRWKAGFMAKKFIEHLRKRK